MSDIVIVGGCIEGLILSILCAEKHNVTLIDIHPEIGFPCSTPGWLENKESLQKYLDNDQLNQLNIFQNKEGFSISAQWLFKLLTIKAVQLNVNVLLRCRVTNVKSSDIETIIQYIGGINSGSGEIICNQLINLTDYCAPSPGKLQHTIAKSTPTKLNQYWGGLALTIDCQNDELQPVLQLIRKDGVSELWFQTKPTWTPNSGWLETMLNTTPKPLTELSIDNSISSGEHLFESINQQ